MNINANIKVKMLRAYKLVADKARSSKEELPRVKDSGEVYHWLVSEIYDKTEVEVTESFYAVFLDRNNGIKGYIKVASGGVSNVLVDPKVIFCAALKCLASGIIVSHNHPTGNTTPSAIDGKLTKALVEGAKLLDMELVDHIIFTPCGYYSFRDHGELTF